MSLTLSKHKAEAESRQAEERKLSDRRRNIIILISKYLLEQGYIDSSMKLQSESTISLEKWDTADNIDLFSILTEFETFYELKFSKPPKLSKKLTGQITESVLPKLNKIPAHVTDNKTRKKTLPPKVIKEEKESKESKENINNKPLESTLDMEIKGSGIGLNKPQENSENDEFFDNRVLKALPPDLLEIPDLRELAQYLHRDICIENPNVKFNDIVGLDRAKSLLKEAVLLPLKYPHLFVGLLEPWKGVLLFGPPGTGKTMLAKAVATECKTTFFNISASSIVSKWRGDSEKLVRVLFELAKYHQPSTIFLDEIDAIMGQRSGQGSEHEASRRMKTELLIQLDGLIKNKERVFLLAASNLPWDLDVAMLRRLEKRILVPLPELNAREVMIKKFLPLPLNENLNFIELASKMQNYSGSDIRLVCKESAMKPVRRLIKFLEENNSNQKTINSATPEPVTENDFLEGLNQTKPTMLISSEKYEKWEKEFGSV